MDHGKMPDTLGDLARRLDELSAEVRKLRDCEEIRQAMYAYARGVDRGDQELLEPSFHEDFQDDHGNFRGDKPTVLAALARSAANKSTTASMHLLGNILIDLEGDGADVETYFVAYQTRVEEGRTFTRARAGRYLDRFERREGTWRLERRRVVDDWSRLDEVVATAREVGPENTAGARDRSDASYALDGFLDKRKRKAARRDA